MVLQLGGCGRVSDCRNIFWGDGLVQCLGGAITVFTDGVCCVYSRWGVLSVLIATWRGPTPRGVAAPPPGSNREVGNVFWNGPEIPTSDQVVLSLI